MTDDELRELGRKLGFDFARFGVELWAGAQEHPGVVEGFESFQGRARPRVAEGHYVRKWLQLRTSALRRRKVVDDAVTVEMLRGLDHPQCPVTLAPLTIASKEATDWSIDRVNNDGGYAIGNLVIMSRRANEAKGAKSLCEVVELAHGVEAVEGLTPREWLRMASLMYGACASGNPHLVAKHAYLPLATRIPNYSTRPSSFEFQRALLDAGSKLSTYKYVKRQLRKVLATEQKWNEVDAMIEMIRRALPSSVYRYDALVNDDLQKRRAKWMFGLSATEARGLRAFMQTAIGGTPQSSTEVSAWSLSSRGLLH